MLKVLEIIFITGICSLFCYAVIDCTVGIVDDIKKVRQTKKPKNKTDYPYLPLGMVTKHFGWSYEYVDKEGWRYVIWFKSAFSNVLGGESIPIRHEVLKAKSRLDAEYRCRQLENEHFGQEEYYRKTFSNKGEEKMRRLIEEIYVKNEDLALRIARDLEKPNECGMPNHEVDMVESDPRLNEPHYVLRVYVKEYPA